MGNGSGASHSSIHKPYCLLTPARTCSFASHIFHNFPSSLSFACQCEGVPSSKSRKECQGNGGWHSKQPVSECHLTSSLQKRSNPPSRIHFTSLHLRVRHKAEPTRKKQLRACEGPVILNYRICTLLHFIRVCPFFTFPVQRESPQTKDR